MGSIRQAIPHMDEPQKSIYESLLEFYETMKKLENDSEVGGKQATKIVMTVADIEDIIKSEIKSKSILFYDWCEKNESLHDWLKEHNHNSSELFEKFSNELFIKARGQKIKILLMRMLPASLILNTIRL